MRGLRKLCVRLLVTIMIGGIALWYWPFEGYITRANCSGIQPGMSRAEVYHLLGGPGWQPDCYTGVPEGEHPEFWHGMVWSVRVAFDNNDRVVRTHHGSRFEE